MNVRLLIFLMVAGASVVTDASSVAGPRNPFWPKGYEGERTPISPDVRKRPKPQPPKPKVDPKVVEEKAAKAAVEKNVAAKEVTARDAAAKEAAAKAAAEKAAREAAEKAEAERKREITPEDWKKAMKSLRIGNPAVVIAQDGSTRSTISINGNIYGEGDLMSVTHEGIRFTWRVQGLTGGEKLKLARLRARRIK